MHGKPCLHLDLNVISEQEGAHQLIKFVKSHDIAILNVAGPRASGDPLIYSAVYRVVTLMLTSCYVANTF